MRVVIAGDAGSGKSTVARIVAGKLGYRHYSVGGFMREIAGKRGMSLLELSRLAETDPSIDEELDEMQRRLGREEDGFVIDSRLGWHFIKDSFKVFLRVDIGEAARRIYGDRRGMERENTTADQTAANIKERKESELKRYRQYYGVDPYDEKHYDAVIDTSSSPPEKVADEIIASLKRS